MLYAVIVGHTPGARGEAQWWDEERRTFLDALKRSGRLALEGTYGENGSLMLIEAESTNDALAFLQNDPYVLASGRLQIRPLVVNLVGKLGEGRQPAGKRPSKRGVVRAIESRKAD